jgi:1,4-dihydroxy-2-naphthoyl-CoA hydrolase
LNATGPGPLAFDQSFDPQTFSYFFAAHGFALHLRLDLVAVQPGWLSAKINIEPIHLNRFGVVHGGVVCGLADHLTGAVLTPLLPPQTWPATVQMNTHLYGSSREGELTAKATVVKLTRRTGVVQIELRNGERDVALATSTVLFSSAPRMQNQTPTSSTNS